MVTIPALQQMKRDGRKIVGVVAWDFQIAQIVDRAGVDIVSVGDTVGINLWGHPSPLEVTMDEMIVVWGNYGLQYSDMLKPGAQLPAAMTAKFVEEAKRLEDAGASLLDFTLSGPVAGPAVVSAVSIPVIGGLGGGPWLDGRMRMAHAAIGYAASALDSNTETYANVARITLDAITAYAEDVRAARQIKGGIPVKPAL